jgi:hypothetical protein
MVITGLYEIQRLSLTIPYTLNELQREVHFLGTGILECVFIEYKVSSQVDNSFLNGSVIFFIEC